MTAPSPRLVALRRSTREEEIMGEGLVVAELDIPVFLRDEGGPKMRPLVGTKFHHPRRHGACTSLFLWKPFAIRKGEVKSGIHMCYTYIIYITYLV